MVDLKKMMEERAALDQQIAELQSKGKADAIGQIKALMAEHGVTAADLATPRASRADKGSKGSSVAPKYKDAAGNTWSGRGLKPKWLTAAIAGGANVDQFKIAA